MLLHALPTSDCGICRTVCSSTTTSRRLWSSEHHLTLNKRYQLSRLWLSLKSTCQYLSGWKCLASSWTGDWHSRSMPQRLQSRATTRLKPSVTYDISWRRNLHRRWHVVWFSWESTTVMISCVVLRPAPSRNFNVWSTMQLRSCSNCRDNPTPSRCCTACTGYRPIRESPTRWR